MKNQWLWIKLVKKQVENDLFYSVQKDKKKICDKVWLIVLAQLIKHQFTFQEEDAKPTRYLFVKITV